MTLLAASAALVMAAGVGYHLGRRAGSARSSWKTRTTRAALGKRAVDLMVLLAVRRVRRKFAAAPVVELLGLRDLAPRHLMRSGW